MVEPGCSVVREKGEEIFSRIYQIFVPVSFSYNLVSESRFVGQGSEQ
jgi:hypothetical protein